MKLAMTIVVVGAIASVRAVALEPQSEAFYRETQKHYDAMRGEDCATHLKVALEFSARPEFDAILNDTERVNYFAVIAVCAVKNREFATSLDAATRVLAFNPAINMMHRVRLHAGLALKDYMTSVDAFDALVPGDAGWIRELELDQIEEVLQAADQLDATGDRALSVHESLAVIDYPPPQVGNYLRIEHARLLLARGRVAEAKARLVGVSDVYSIATMRIDNQFDPLREDPEFESRLDMKAAAERDVEMSRAAVTARPELLEEVFQLVDNLQATRREAEALAIVEATLEKLKSDTHGFTDAVEWRSWIVAQRGYLLYLRGRPEEGYAALREAADLAEDGEPNVSQVINLAGHLMRAGRGAEVLTMLERAGTPNAYGRAWIESLRSCAGVLTGDEAQRIGGLEYLKAHEADNPSALSRTLLCSNDLDAAAALMLRRLENPEWRTDALMALQFRPPTYDDFFPFQRQIRERFDLLRIRTDVLAAVNRVGRIEIFPIELGVRD